MASGCTVMFLVVGGEGASLLILGVLGPLRGREGRGRERRSDWSVLVEENRTGIYNVSALPFFSLAVAMALTYWC